MKKMATSPPPFMHGRDGSGPKARFIWDVILVSDTFFSVAILTQAMLIQSPTFQISGQELNGQCF